MAAPPFEGSEYKKDLTHNLGYKPIVRAFAWVDGYYKSGLRDIPIWYWVSNWDPNFGVYFTSEQITYEHLDDNTIRFYGPENTEIVIQLYLEPRKDAWYE